MSFSKLSSMQLHAIEPYMVDVEVDISRGLNAFSIVGLPDKSVEEAKDRISAAIKNSGFDSPKSKNHKVVIALAPAELRKGGTNFDLAMALGYLLAIGEISFDPSGKVFIGELSLDGSLRSAKGVLPLVMAAKRKGMKEIYIPYRSAEEASIVEGIDIFPINDLGEVVEHLNIRRGHQNRPVAPLVPTVPVPKKREVEADFKHIKGLEGAKRALEIAASGRHNIVLYGPPGTGKTMLARAFASILPELSFEEALEVTTIHSLAGLVSSIVTFPPFRAPHHSATHAAIIGGGAMPKPGEITLAHRGVLFMDEFPEFDPSVMESLRQPLEDKVIRISRTKATVIYPADFILLAAMNPCPCGYLGSRTKKCECSYAAIVSYRRRISGPIADRIDMWVEVSEVDYKKLGADGHAEPTEVIGKKVEKARNVRRKQLGALQKPCRDFLDASSEALGISARGYYKLVSISRTIAALEGSKEVEEKHMLEALQYRPKF